MIPFLLKEKYRWIQAYHGIKTVLTIHNLEFQGQFDPVECCGTHSELDLNAMQMERFGGMIAWTGWKLVFYMLTV